MLDNIQSITVLEKNGKKYLDYEKFIDEPLKAFKKMPNGQYKIRIDYKDKDDGSPAKPKTRRISVELKEGRLSQIRNQNYDNYKKEKEMNSNNNMEIIQNPKTIVASSSVTDELTKQIADTVIDIMKPILDNIRNLSEETQKATLGLIRDYQKNPVNDFMDMVKAFQKFQEIVSPDSDFEQDEELDYQQNPKGGDILTALLSNPAIINSFMNILQPKQQPKAEPYTNTQSMRGIEERLAMLERENAELKARG